MLHAQNFKQVHNYAFKYIEFYYSLNLKCTNLHIINFFNIDRVVRIDL